MIFILFCFNSNKLTCNYPIFYSVDLLYNRHTFTILNERSTNDKILLVIKIGPNNKLIFNSQFYNFRWMYLITLN